MKKIFFLLAAFTLLNISAYSQTATKAVAPLKIGITSIDYLLSELPEAKRIEDNLKNYEEQLMNQMQSKIEEFQRKVQVYQQQVSTMSELVRADKEEELYNLQNSIKKFEQDAQLSMQQKQGELLAPILEKVEKAVEAVAKEHGYTHIFNFEQGGVQFVLFADESSEVSDLILNKLGVKTPVSSK
jgi:outer membrane protein